MKLGTEPKLTSETFAVNPRMVVELDVFAGEPLDVLVNGT